MLRRRWLSLVLCSCGEGETETQCEAPLLSSLSPH
jgi:hypothetical protein